MSSSSTGARTTTRIRQVHLLQDRTDKYHDVREPLPSPRRCWIRQVPLRKTNVYHYFHDARERLPPRRPVNVYEMYHYRRPVNVYFPLRTRSARNARFEGITPRRCSWTECMLYEMPVFASCPFVTRFHATIPWEPGRRDHPTIFCMFRTSAHLLFCTGISMSYRIIGMLPWHHFRYRCRGTIFVIVAVAPFSLSLPWHPFCSAMVTKCSLSY